MTLGNTKNMSTAGNTWQDPYGMSAVPLHPDHLLQFYCLDHLVLSVKTPASTGAHHTMTRLCGRNPAHNLLGQRTIQI